MFVLKFSTLFLYLCSTFCLSKILSCSMRIQRTHKRSLNFIFLYLRIFQACRVFREWNLTRAVKKEKLILKTMCEKRFLVQYREVYVVIVKIYSCSRLGFAELNLFRAFKGCIVCLCVLCNQVSSLFNLLTKKVSIKWKERKKFYCVNNNNLGNRI